MKETQNWLIFGTIKRNYCKYYRRQGKKHNLLVNEWMRWTRKCKRIIKNVLMKEKYLLLFRSAKTVMKVLQKNGRATIYY